MDLQGVLQALTVYRAARSDFLDELGCAGSNRDPFAEFAERLVALWLGGSLAASRVQRGWDLCDPSGRTVQVRYLANPSGGWVNEHHVQFVDGLDRYALVVVEAFEFSGAVCFDGRTLAQVGARLGKRHGNQESTLQLTQSNWRKLVAERSSFLASGVELLLPGDLGTSAR